MKRRTKTVPPKLLNAQQIQRIATLLRSAAFGVTDTAYATEEHAKQRQQGVYMAARRISWAMQKDLEASDISQAIFQSACGIPPDELAL